MTVKVDEDSLNRTIEKLSKINDLVRTGAQREVRSTALAIQSDARMRVPVASNRLRSSINTKFRGDKMGAEVFTDVHYARRVEEGRKPGRMPPSSALEAWVRTKITAAEKEIKGIAFVIARKIGREGTEAQPFLGPAAEKEKPRYFIAMRTMLRNIKNKI